MRHVVPCLALALLLALVGCTNTRWGMLNRPPDTPPTGPVPSVAALVKYMDDNAERVRSLRSDDVELTVSQGWKSFPLSASLACERPRNFRMTAKVAGSPEVDLGSNPQEFWFWIKRADTPYQFYCSYDALAQAANEGRRTPLPFPFQPDWVAETLGMGSYGPPERYQLVQEPERYKLVAHVQGPQGKMLKVIVFNRWSKDPPNPQITDYLLLEEGTNKEICSAHVTEVQGDWKTTGVIPRRMELRWPEAKVKLGLRLNRVAMNPALPGPLFVRQPLSGVPSYDLATGKMDGQLNAMQRVRGPR